MDDIYCVFAASTTGATFHCPCAVSMASYYTVYIPAAPCTRGLPCIPPAHAASARNGWGKPVVTDSVSFDVSLQ